MMTICLKWIHVSPQWLTSKQEQLDASELFKNLNDRIAPWDPYVEQSQAMEADFGIKI